MSRPKKGDAALRRTKTYIQEHGWIQGRSRDPITGAVCLSHACWEANSYRDGLIIARRIAKVLVMRGLSIVGFNDRVAGSVDDVYALIDRTIKEG